MGRKSDYTQIVPMCHTHHEEMHRLGEKTFQRKYGLDLDMIAQVVTVRWEEHNG